MDKSNQKMTPTVSLKRKQYHPPALTIYGDLREITKTIIGGTGMNDGIHGNDKTGF